MPPPVSTPLYLARRWLPLIASAFAAATPPHLFRLAAAAAEPLRHFRRHAADDADEAISIRHYAASRF